MIVDNLDIPDKWCELLIDVQRYCPQAMIAGGALRDLYNGVEVSDVDFFTLISPTWAIDDTGFDYKGMQYVLDVLGGQVQGVEVNVIIVDTLGLPLLESFDFGMCQIGFDGKSLIKTPAFDWDIKHSLFTLRHIERYQRSIKRFARISQRYPLWNIAIPELEKGPK